MAGTVLAPGEYWTAESEEVVDAGERVEVTAGDGLPLRCGAPGPDPLKGVTRCWGYGPPS